jgi:pilus assembly protein CpaC
MLRLVLIVPLLVLALDVAVSQEVIRIEDIAAQNEFNHGVAQLLKAAEHLEATGHADEARRLRELAGQQKRSQAEAILERRLAERDALNKEISRLRQATGRHQHVAIHATLAELSLTKAREAGVKFDGIDRELLAVKGIAGLLAEGCLKTRKEGKQTPAPEVARESGDTLSFGVVEDVDLLEKIITTLERKGALKKLANPTITTVSGRPASFNVGGEFPIAVPGGLGSTTAIEFRQYGTRLDCVPIVLGGGKVRLELRPRVSHIDPSRQTVIDGVTVPGLRERWVDIAVELGVGQTFALAGLVQERVTSDEKSEGAADGEAKSEVEQTELVVLVRCEVCEAPRTARPACPPALPPAGLR